MFSTPDFTIVLPGSFTVEIIVVEINGSDQTKARLLGPKGQTITHTQLRGNCPTAALTQMLDAEHSPLGGFDDSVKAGRMAAIYINNY